MLDPRRGEHTEPARRTAISRDGREFDPSTDRWKLNKDLTLNLRLALRRLDPPLRAPYRAVMEHFARNYSAAYCSAIQMFLLAFLRATGATSLDETALLNYRAGLDRNTEYKLGYFRAFLARWYDQGYPGVTADTIKLLKSFRLRGNEKGAAVKSKAAYLRRPIPKNWRDTRPTWSFKSIREHWEQVKARQPKSFPVLVKTTGLKWSEALFCMHASSLHAGLPTDWYRLFAPTTTTLNDLIRPAGTKHGVLQELGYTEPDGTPIRLTTHQARHYQSTIAERGGMSQYDLANSENLQGLLREYTGG